MSQGQKPIVRLATSLGKPAKKAASSTGEVIKLAVRLHEGVNEALRQMTRYRGDLTKFTLEALEAVDLGRAAAVSTEQMVADTTISLPRDVHARVKQIARRRQTSMNVIVNTALAHWLAKKGAVDLG